MPIYHPLINSNIYVTITLLFLLALSLFLNFHHRKGFNILSAIFHPASVRDYNTPVASLQITSLILAIFALIGYSTMFLYLSGRPDDWLTFGLCTGATLLFFTLKYLVVEMFFSTMYNGVEPKFLSRYHQLNVLFGVLAYIACIILAFSVETTPFNAMIMATVLIVIYCVAVSYIYITTFFSNIYSAFALFLYLCTLEILPYLALVKILREF